MEWNFEKRLLFLPIDETGHQFLFPIGNGAREHIKVASRKDLLPKVAEFIGTLKSDPSHRYVLLNALGASEYWGSNKNGDAFIEAGLVHPGDDYGHKTFLKAGVFRHHLSKDPTLSGGKVVLSEYNPAMHRVELVVRYDAHKDPETVRLIDGNQLFACSMGAKVPSDLCSVCDHESKTAADYCEHLQPGEINTLTSDGKLKCAINLFPRFFDISRVLIGADRTARSYGKVASMFAFPDWMLLPSGLVARKMAEDKQADIEKEIPAEVGHSAGVDALNKFQRLKDGLRASAKRVKSADLRTCSAYKLASTLSSFASLGIALEPDEFQYLTLYKFGQKKLAENLARLGQHFVEAPASAEAQKLASTVDLTDAVEPQVVKIAGQYLEDRSVFQPYLLKRAMAIVPCASSFKAVFMPGLDVIAGLYSIYRDKLAEFALSPLTRAQQAPSVQDELFKEALDFGATLGTRELGTREETVKDIVAGTLLSPSYKFSSEAIDRTNAYHWKLASSLKAPSAGQIQALHPDTSAWMTVLQVNERAQRWAQPRSA